MEKKLTKNAKYVQTKNNYLSAKRIPDPLKLISNHRQSKTTDNSN